MNTRRLSLNGLKYLFNIIVGTHLEYLKKTSLMIVYMYIISHKAIPVSYQVQEESTGFLT